MRKTLMAALCALMFAADAAEKEKVLFVCAHPDDLIASIGTCLLMKDRFEIHVCDFTHGEFGLGRKGFEDGTTKATRTKEEETVCAELGAKLHWLDEIDGSAHATPETCKRLAALIGELKPRAVFGHWPIDCHADHVMAAAALQKAAILAGFRGEYYFFEEGMQAKGFTPTYYVDVTRVMDEKRRIVRLYACQNRNDSLVKYEIDSVNRGRGNQMRFRPNWETDAEVFAPYPGTGQGSRIIFTELGK